METAVIRACFSALGPGLYHPTAGRSDVPVGGVTAMLEAP